MRRHRIGCLLFVSILAACRDSSGDAGASLTVVPNASGANGCSGPDQVFAPPQTPTVIPLASLVIGPASQITADGADEVLYATGDGASVVMLDVSVDPPAEAVIVAPGAIAALLAPVGIATAPVLSGIAVLDADRLVVVEQTSNTLIAVDRLPPNAVSFYAGQPNETPGFADGFAQGATFLARFSFGFPTQICPTGNVPPKVFVADAGNHAIRLVQSEVNAPLQVITIAGNGTPLSTQDGELSETLFDTPTGLSATCDGDLLVTERGGNGFGQLVRQLEIGRPDVFGGFLGTVTTLAGDGTDATTQGVDELAQVAGPVSPLATGAGEIYWIDSNEGVLRRRKLDGEVDCPLAADCAAAVLAPTFPPGHDFCLTQTAAGSLFVMDATDGVLYRVSP